MSVLRLNYAPIFFYLSPTFLSLSHSNSESGLVLSLFTFLTVLIPLLTAVAEINGRSQEVNNHETTQSGPFLNTIERSFVCVRVCLCVCVRVQLVCVGWWLLELPLLLIIDLREASGMGLRPLWDNTTMIMSDLQPSALLVMTLQDFLLSPRFIPPPFSFLPNLTFALHLALLFFCL